MLGVRQDLLENLKRKANGIFNSKNITQNLKKNSTKKLRDCWYMPTSYIHKKEFFELIPQTGNRVDYYCFDDQRSIIWFDCQVQN